jgi:hypothetical protein
VNDSAALIISAVISGVVGPLVVALVVLALGNRRKLVQIHDAVNGNNATLADAAKTAVAENVGLRVENATLRAQGATGDPQEAS